MQVDEYQAAAMRTYNASLEQRDMLVNSCLGLAGEAGEVCDILKKHLMQGHPLNRDTFAEELGDVLWYAALACEAVGLQLGDVMRANIVKLSLRYPEGFSSERSLNREP